MMTPDHAPLVNFTTERLAYGPLTEAHIPLSAKWANDWAISRPRGMIIRPYSLDTARQWNESGRTNPQQAVFIIYELASNRPIGETGLTSIDWFHRTAEFGVLIGETECWGRGYGTEATLAMLAYGFSSLNLHAIWLRVSASNPRGIRAYQRAGFQEAGRLREAQVIDGERWDVVYMECLAREFSGRLQQDEA
jgi:RimJ/RimL family protein N-acetyltransferase